MGQLAHSPGYCVPDKAVFNSVTLPPLVFLASRLETSLQQTCVPVYSEERHRYPQTHMHAYVVCAVAGGKGYNSALCKHFHRDPAPATPVGLRE